MIWIKSSVLMTGGEVRYPYSLLLSTTVYPGKNGPWERIPRYKISKYKHKKMLCYT